MSRTLFIGILVCVDYPDYNIIRSIPVRHMSGTKVSEWCLSGPRYCAIWLLVSETIASCKDAQWPYENWGWCSLKFDKMFVQPSMTPKGICNVFTAMITWNIDISLEYFTILKMLSFKSDLHISPLDIFLMSLKIQNQSPDYARYSMLFIIRTELLLGIVKLTVALIETSPSMILLMFHYCFVLNFLVFVQYIDTTVHYT